jgi:hypothetical protein
MSKYQEIEIQVNNITSIEDWNEKINKVKEIKQEIKNEMENLTDIINMLNSDMNITTEMSDIKKKKKYSDINALIKKFNESETIEEMIKYYQYIGTAINIMEKELFE